MFSENSAKIFSKHRSSHSDMSNFQIKSDALTDITNIVSVNKCVNCLISPYQKLVKVKLAGNLTSFLKITLKEKYTYFHEIY